jgi:hypothetical protein
MLHRRAQTCQACFARLGIETEDGATAPVPGNVGSGIFEEVPSLAARESGELFERHPISRFQPHSLRGEDCRIGKQAADIVAEIAARFIPKGKRQKQLLIEERNGRNIVDTRAVGGQPQAFGGEVLGQQSEKVVRAVKLQSCGRTSLSKPK